MRRRFQKGTLVNRNGVLTGMWYEYVALPDGTQKAVKKAKAFPGLSERQARAALQPILDAANRSNISPSVVQSVPKQRTLNDAIAEWKRIALPTLTLRSRRAAESHLRAHIIPKLGQLALANLCLKEVDEFVQAICEGRSGKQVLNIVTTLQGVLRCVRKWGWEAPHVSTADLHMPKIKKPPVKMFTRAEIHKVIEAAGKSKTRLSQVLRIVLQLLASTGMRINEALALTLEDIDFEKGLIHVRHSVDGDKTLGDPKTESSKADIPMPGALAKLLSEYLKSEHYRENARGLLFANRNDRPFCDSKLREYGLAPLLRNLKIRQMGFHAIRHAVASQLIDAAVPITVVRDQLRHSDVRVTLGVYGHVVGNAQREAMERLSKRMIW